MGGVTADGVSSLIVAAGEARLAQGGIRKHDAFLCHESRDWALWRLDGWGAGRPRRKEGEWVRGHRLPSPPCFVEFAYVFRLSVAGEHPFRVLIYMNSYTFHIYFIY